jgi:hypothetical protein
MAIKFKKTYRFALVSTTYITLFSTGFLGLLLWFFGKFSFSICLLFAVSIALLGFSSCDRLTDFITSKLNKNQVTKDKQASDLADKKKVGETNSDDVNTSEIPGDAGVEDSEYVGTYAGQFGNYTIQLVIEQVR